ncbi:hypothetical protein C8F01DRAFT_1240155 [Mycena amicta]|nr:hypothetical protein C8F01DRAFT_1240155 [Mycena amicta]
MQLRGNLIAQPGAPDMPAPKRTTDEVQQEKTAKAAQKQQIVADRDRAVTSAAAIGHRISEQDASRKTNAHRPAEVPVTRVSRKRPETKSVVGAPSDPGPSTATAAKPGLPYAEDPRALVSLPSPAAVAVAAFPAVLTVRSVMKMATALAVSTRTRTIRESARLRRRRQLAGKQLEEMYVVDAEELWLMVTFVETVVPGVVVPSARHIPAAQRGAHARRRTNHTLETLPAPIRKALTKDVFPHAIESHFSQNDNPWNEISQQQVFELYTEVTTQEHAGEEDVPVQKTMHHQVVQKFHAFCNKMASAAVEVGAVLINALADKHDLTRSQVVDDLLEIVDPEMEISQFCFREVEFDADGGCYPRGLFQSEGVLYVFAVFCTFTKCYGALGPIFFKPNDWSTWPRAALVLAVQALKRVLNYSHSGDLVLTKSSTTDFSKANWDDHYEYPEGVRTAVASTSSIAAAVEQLTEAYWERIIKAAQVIAGSSSNTADRQEEDVRAISQMWRQGRQLFVRDYDDDDGMGDDNADKTMVDEDAEQLMPPGEASADVNPHSSSPSPAQGS